MISQNIKVSLYGLLTVLFFSVVLLSITKPTFVTSVTPDGRKKINWGKLLSLSVVLSVLMAIVLYLVKTPKVSHVEPVKMSFKKISDCY